MKKVKQFMAMAVMFAVLAGIFCNPNPVSAAAATRCYTISSNNTRVYGNSGLTSPIGWIYGSDEVTVLSAASQYAYVSYPVSGGRTRNGYIATNAILTATSGTSCRAAARVTTYKRPGGDSYGYVSQNDSVMILAASGGYTQVRYNVSGGYKLAFIPTGDVERYIKGSTGGGNDAGSADYASVADGTYVIRSAMDNNKVVDANGLRPVTDGTNIELCSYNGGDNQKYRITSAGSGWYKIVCAWGDKSLDIDGGVRRTGANIMLYGQHGGDNQLWRFQPAGNGYYYIQSKIGLYMDVTRANTADGTNIIAYELNGGNNQKWKLEQVSASNMNPANTNTNTGNTALSYGLYKSSSAYISCGFDGYRTTSGRHEGIDMVYYDGAPVYSLTDGVVIRVTYGQNGRSGLSTISIYDEAADKSVIYLHSNPVTLSVGQRISKGQKIATQGWRGVSSLSGSHTHVEVRDGRQSSAAYSVDDPRLDNTDPSPYWASKGYTIR